MLALLDRFDETPVGAPTRLAIYTGLRRGELLALSWDDIDLERRVLPVRRSLEVVHVDGERMVCYTEPKTKKSRREVSLTATALEVLRRQRAEQARLRLAVGGAWGDETLVLPDPRTGEAWKPDSFSK